MRTLLGDVKMWSSFSERMGYDFNSYGIEDVVVDPVVEEIADAKPRRIVLTNRNHFRAAARVRELCGARIAVHPDDEAFVTSKGCAPDDFLAVGEQIGPLVVAAAAGKSPGEIALLWPARRALIVGDACVGKPAGGPDGSAGGGAKRSGALSIECALLPPAVIDDVAALQRSLAALAQLDFDALLLCDGAPILSGGRDALRRLVASF